MGLKDQLRALESENATREQQLKIEREKVAALQQDLAQLSAAKDEASGALRRKKLEVQSSWSSRDRVKGTISDKRQELQNVREELKKIEAVERGEVAAVERAENLGKDLAQIQNALAELQIELRALSSDAAKKAALDAAGGPLPAEVVPRANLPKDLSSEENAIWTSKDVTTSSASDRLPKELGATAGTLEDQEAPLPNNLRVALQSKAVLSALTKSLALHVEELHTGLRQWSFACCTLARTEELMSSLQQNMADLKKELAELAGEHEQITRQDQADKETRIETASNYQQFQSRHGTLLADLKAVVDNSCDLEAKRTAALERKELFLHQQEAMTLEQAEAERDLQAERIALSAHAVEGETRVIAAGKLLRRAQDQAEHDAAELMRVKQEAECFHQAFAVLKTNHDKLEGELSEERNSLQRLQDDHDELNYHLNALANHYAKAMPTSFASFTGTAKAESFNPSQSFGLNGQLVVGMR